MVLKYIIVICGIFDESMSLEFVAVAPCSLFIVHVITFMPGHTKSLNFIFDGPLSIVFCLFRDYEQTLALVAWHFLHSVSASHRVSIYSYDVDRILHNYTYSNDIVVLHAHATRCAQLKPIPDC